MRIDGIKGKLINCNTYFKKDEKGNKTEELGYMFTVAIDFKDEKGIRNKVISPICSKEDFEMLVDIHDLSFGCDCILDLDIPILDSGDKAVIPPVLYSFRLNTLEDKLPF